MQNNYTKHKLVGQQIPERLRVIDAPPRQIFYRGSNPRELLFKPTVSIVGSRKPTPYGRAVTQKLATEIARSGGVIISGLALGIDSVAHQACIEADGQTIAVLPCGPEMVYPATHRGLAKQIIDTGGALLTEFDEGTPPLRQNFIARNRLVSALGDIVIITEAAENSGTIHTASFALNQGKTVMAVPGPITSPLSKGTNNLIKAGALPLTATKDVLDLLGIDTKQQATVQAYSAEEQALITLLKQGITDGSVLLAESQLEPQIFNQTLTILEINAVIQPLGNNHWRLV